jgi:uncharacterized protein YdaU (DUF1376 family)
MAEKKTPKHDTWMPLYVGDYLVKTTSLNAEQHGGYLLLLMTAWKSEGRLPADPQELQQIARMTPQQWARNEGVLRKFFQVTPDGWTNERVIEELEKAKENVAKKSKAGHASAAARWGLPRQQH